MFLRKLRKRSKYAHNYQDHYVDQEYMPHKTTYYEPTDIGFEKEIQKRMMNLKILDNEKSTPTMNKNCDIHYVYNLSQTDYFQTKEKSVSKPSISVFTE